MKRFICLLTALCLLMALPVTALAGDAGTCGEGITWEYSEGVLTISGSGRMSDFAEGGEPWGEYKGTITTVKFTGGVTYVGAFAFKNYDKLTSLSLDAKTEELGTSAFQGCDGLTKLTVPFTGKFIMGEDSLRGCSNLKRIDFSGRFPKFKSNCLWDTYATLYYPSDAPWPADTIRELENAFSGRIEFRSSDGTDPVKPTEATQPKPTEAPKPTQKPQPVVTTPATSTATAPTWSIPSQPTFSVPTFSMPEFTQPEEQEDQGGGSFSGWLAIVIVIGVLAAFAAVTIHVQQVQRRNRRNRRRQRPNFQQ